MKIATQKAVSDVLSSIKLSTYGAHMNIFGSQRPTRDIVVIGASAGGIEALRELVRQLPADFPAAVFVTVHIPAEYPSNLPQILSRVSKIPVLHPTNTEKIERGHIYVAPPDHHLLIAGEHIRLSHGPRENNFRPSIDVLFRSAAWSCGSRVTGVILSGVLDDGAAGLLAVKSRGGKAIVQDPADASFPDLPLNVMRIVEVDQCVPVGGIGDLLNTMVNEPADEAQPAAPEAMDIEVKIALEENAFEKGVMAIGELTSYTCPECHGALAQIMEGRLTRFRCHTGHAFSLHTLLVEVSKNIETALWTTLSRIEEGELLLNHIAGHLQQSHQEEAARIVLQKSSDAEERAKVIRQLLLNYEILSQEKMGITINGQDKSR